MENRLDKYLSLKADLKNLGNKYANSLSNSTKEIATISKKINKLKYVVDLLKNNLVKEDKLQIKRIDFNIDVDSILGFKKIFPDNTFITVYGYWIGSIVKENETIAFAVGVSDNFKTDLSDNFIDTLYAFKYENFKWVKLFQIDYFFKSLISRSTPVEIKYNENKDIVIIRVATSVDYIHTIKLNTLEIKDSSLPSTGINLTNRENITFSNDFIYVKTRQNNNVIELDYDLNINRYLNFSNLEYTKKVFYNNNLYYLRTNNTITKYDLLLNIESTILPSNTTNNYKILQFKIENDKIILLSKYNNPVNNCGVTEIFDGIFVEEIPLCNITLKTVTGTGNLYHFNSNGDIKDCALLNYNDKYLVLVKTSDLANPFDLKLFEINKLGKINFIQSVFKNNGENANFSISNVIRLNNDMIIKDKNKLVFFGGTGGGGALTNSFSIVVSFYNSCKPNILNLKEFENVFNYGKKIQ